jgi:hypothetical protein
VEIYARLVRRSYQIEEYGLLKYTDIRAICYYKTTTMTKESHLYARVAALKKNFENIKFTPTGRCYGASLEPLLPLYTTLIKDIKSTLGDLYSDIPNLPLPKSIGGEGAYTVFNKVTVEPLMNNLDYILELHSHMRIGGNIETKEKKNRVFISHGNSKEWYKLQAYIEKDLGFQTLELAQEPNIGRTIIQKLYQEAERCSVAIIVMTGEDITVEDVIRTRENVMHEIGFFQGLYGLNNIILLHEENVNIPSNIHGLVYIPFPKDTVEATFGAVLRELKVIMN